MGTDAVHDWRFEQTSDATTVKMQESFGGLVAPVLKRSFNATLIGRPRRPSWR
jgi:hypothetical protein